MITKQTLRLRADKQYPGLNQLNPSLRLWNGNEARIDLFFSDNLNAVDISNFASIAVEVDLSQTSTQPPLMFKEVEAEDFDLTTTSLDWANGTKAHVSVEFSREECELDLGGAASKTFWMVIWGVTMDGDRVTLDTGTLTVVEDNAGGVGGPEPEPSAAPLVRPQTFRFALDPDRRQALSNPADGQPFRMWKGNHTRFELGLFAGETVRDISNLVTISVEVDVSQTSALAPLMYKEIPAEDFDPTLDAESWADGSKAHARVAFTGTECNLDLGGEKSKTFWMVIWGATDEGEIVTLGFGQFTVEDDNAGTAGVPPATGPTYYTQEQANALFPQAYREEIDWEVAEWLDVAIPDPMLVEEILLTADAEPTGAVYSLGTPLDAEAFEDTASLSTLVLGYSVNQIITGGIIRLKRVVASSVPATGHIIVKGVKL